MTDLELIVLAIAAVVCIAFPFVMAKLWKDNNGGWWPSAHV